MDGYTYFMSLQLPLDLMSYTWNYIETSLLSLVLFTATAHVKPICATPCVSSFLFCMAVHGSDLQLFYS